MATIQLPVNYNPLIIHDAYGNVDSIFWEWRISELGGVIGDSIDTPIYDVEAIFDGANNKLKYVPKIAILYVRTYTSVATVRIIRDEYGQYCPMLALSPGGPAYDNAAGNNRMVKGQITSRKIYASAILAADSTPGAPEFIRFGFSWSTI